MLMQVVYSHRPVKTPDDIIVAGENFYALLITPTDAPAGRERFDPLQQFVVFETKLTSKKYYLKISYKMLFLVDTIFPVVVLFSFFLDDGRISSTSFLLDQDVRHLHLAGG